MSSNTYSLNDVVEMKKKHPCGQNKWVIVRFGADVKLMCSKCDRVVMLERHKFIRNVKRKIENE